MRTKIIATIGPATRSKEMLRKIIGKGVDVCRLNFSHGNYAVHAETIRYVREINEEDGSNIAILADLQGPKIRVGDIENGEIQLVQGEEIKLSSKPCMGTKEMVHISYNQIARDVKKDEIILMDDGKLSLRIKKSLDETTVLAEVVEGGPLRPRKGVNLPHTKLSLPSLTEKDRKDLAFILTQEVHWIALSFVRHSNDIAQLRKLIDDAAPKKKPWIMAKIEKPEALEDIDDIIEISDGLMVARGDLGVEIPLQKVPMVQKRLINKCIHEGKPIVVATQLLEGMIDNSRPTRAEASDVANSVMDGADAVMLSGETSVGKYPAETVETMQKIIHDVESYRSIYYKHNKPEDKGTDRYLSEAIIFEACKLARQMDATAMISITHSGFSALKTASHRPKAEIYAMTYDHFLLCQLNLVWGIKAMIVEGEIKAAVEISRCTIRKLLEKGLLQKGDYVINTASLPFYIKGKTNSLKVSIAGEDD